MMMRLLVTAPLQALHRSRRAPRSDRLHAANLVLTIKVKATKRSVSENHHRAMRIANGENRFGAQGGDRTGEACQTRAQIVEAGATLMAERPFEALTVDAVVE